MNGITITTHTQTPFSYKEEVHDAINALQTLINRTGAGNNFLGWVDLPQTTTITELNQINEVTQDLCNGIDLVVVVGIGGSYLGAKAVIDALSHSFTSLLPHRKHPIVLFAGQNIGEDYLAELLETMEHYSVACIVVSKSGATLEPAIAFRVMKEYIYIRYGKEEAQRRIVAITDSSKGALRTMANQEGYRTFVIPDDVGGRFSVLTPVGLLPVAISGIDIFALMEGARAFREEALKVHEDNPCIQYAAWRNALYHRGKSIEILANYHPKLHALTEWWKQLFGESEGKEGRGIFPTGLDFTTDLHSMGQYVQEGPRTMMETVLSISKSNGTLYVPIDRDNFDGLNYLSGKSVDFCNQMAEMGVRQAHLSVDVPNIRIEVPQLSPYYVGALLYFFQTACAISAYMLGVNPFTQPGVEAYKKNMGALLGGPPLQGSGA